MAAARVELPGSAICALGTDGFGRSDTRAALRDFFEVDRYHIVLASLAALRERVLVDEATCERAIERYGLVTDTLPPWCR